MMELEKGDILTLPDGLEYVILEILFYQHKTYLYLGEIDAEERPKENVKIVKAVKLDEHQYGTVEIDDPEEFQYVKNTMIQMFELDYIDDEI